MYVCNDGVVCRGKTTKINIICVSRKAQVHDKTKPNKNIIKATVVAVYGELICVVHTK